MQAAYLRWQPLGEAEAKVLPALIMRRLTRSLVSGLASAAEVLLLSQRSHPIPLSVPDVLMDYTALPGSRGTY